jgi:3-hydroxyisobutyrate dehydrogenase-like beta-hydroxyacid dehydrogenase
MKVGFIGVGAMGLPMARNVLGRAEVVAHDLDPQRVQSLARMGAEIAVSAREVAERSDVVIVMVATPAQLDSVLFGSGGAGDALRSGQAVIIMSSVGVAALRDVERHLAPRGALVVDAPVTGGVARADTAELTVFAGAAEDAFAVVEPVLRMMASRVARCGPNVGDGQAVKLVNQLLCSVHLAAAAEALAFASALGLDPRSVLAAVEHGAASSFMLSDRGPRMLAADEPPARSAVDIFVKDSSLVLQAAHEVAAHVPLVERAAEQFARARSRGWGRRDDSTVIGLYAGAQARGELTG